MFCSLSKYLFHLFYMYFLLITDTSDPGFIPDQQSYHPLLFQTMLVRRLVVVRRCAQLLLAGRRCSSSGTVPADTAVSAAASTADLFEFGHRFPAEQRDSFLASFRLHVNFVNDAEEGEFVRELNPHLMRHKYETDHWDNVSMSSVIIFGVCVCYFGVCSSMAIFIN
jgi:hypothetical protein